MGGDGVAAVGAVGKGSAGPGQVSRGRIRGGQGDSLAAPDLLFAWCPAMRPEVAPVVDGPYDEVAGLGDGILEAADEGIAVLLGPAFELAEVVLVQVEDGAAVRAGDGVDAVATGFAPADNGAEGETVALAEVRDDLGGAWAELLDAGFGYTNEIAHSVLREDGAWAAGFVASLRSLHGTDRGKEMQRAVLAEVARVGVRVVARDEAS
jgi:hypothetical protein